MSIRPTYRIISLILALVVFSTSVGISMDFHYCQGELKSVALFSKAKSCHEIAAAKNQMPSCHKHKSMVGDGIATDEKDCCTNETKVLKMDNDFIDTLTPTFKTNIVAFVAIFILRLDTSTLFLDTKALAHEHYKPPLPNQHIYILQDQFLI